MIHLLPLLACPLLLQQRVSGKMDAAEPLQVLLRSEPRLGKLVFGATFEVQIEVRNDDDSAWSVQGWRSGGCHPSPSTPFRVAAHESRNLRFSTIALPGPQEWVWRARFRREEGGDDFEKEIRVLYVGLDPYSADLQLEDPPSGKGPPVLQLFLSSEGEEAAPALGPLPELDGLRMKRIQLEKERSGSFEQWTLRFLPSESGKWRVEGLPAIPVVVPSGLIVKKPLAELPYPRKAVLMSVEHGQGFGTFEASFPELSGVERVSWIGDPLFSLDSWQWDEREHRLRCALDGRFRPYWSTATRGALRLDAHDRDSGAETHLVLGLDCLFP